MIISVNLIEIGVKTDMDMTNPGIYTMHILLTAFFFTGVDGTDSYTNQ